MIESTLLLSQEDVVAALASADLVGAAEDAFKEVGKGMAIMPPKLNMNLGEDGKSWPYHYAFMDSMPSYLDSRKLAAVKVVGGYWNNRKRSLPSIIGVIELIDPCTGKLLCVMDGTWITAFRTAAVSVLGARYLGAGSPKHVLICGAGVQGITHAILAAKTFQLEHFALYDTNQDVLRNTVGVLSRVLNCAVTGVESPVAEAKNADLVFAATATKKPFITREWLKEKGGFLCTIGSYPEAEENVLEWADKVFVDNLEQTKHRGALAGFFRKQAQYVSSKVTGEMPQVVIGALEGRSSGEENIWYVPRGMGIVDLAAGEIAYREAKRMGIGNRFDFKEQESPVSLRFLETIMARNTG